MELKVCPTRRPQESSWLLANKLKPQRGTMLLLAAEKLECFMGLLFFLLFEFCQAGYAARSESPHGNRVASKL